jgi:hypothetical protein
MLKKDFEILQKRMLLQLEEIRAKYDHPGNKGSNAEQVLKEFLRAYLPASNRIGHGEVTDLSAARSRQVDVVITNEYHPFLNDLATPGIFFIEGVLCVGEVKSVLTGDPSIGGLRACVAKCCS